jgi:hypothetical protein
MTADSAQSFPNKIAPEPSLTDSDVTDLRNQIIEVTSALARAKDGVSDARDALEQARVLLGELEHRDQAYALNAFASSISDAEDGVWSAGDSLDKAESAAEEAVSDLDLVDTSEDAVEVDGRVDNDDAGDNEEQGDTLNTASGTAAGSGPAPSQTELPLSTVATTAGVEKEEGE